MMNEQIFQRIFDEIQEFIPSEWEKVVFCAEYIDESYSMNFYIKTPQGAYTDGFYTNDRIQMFKLFTYINNELSKERKKLPKKQKWTVFTMIVDMNGNMKTEFEYDDISESKIQHEREWKEKYLV